MKETLRSSLAVGRRVYYMRRCTISFHLLMSRASALEEQKHHSTSILEHDLKKMMAIDGLHSLQKETVGVY